MKGCLGVIIGNRGVFPGCLAEEERKEVVDILKREGIEAILPASNETKYGAIENFKEARKCAELFRKNSERIDGILVSLPNFGDERAIADTIRMSALSVPVLIQAFPDKLVLFHCSNFPKIMLETVHMEYNAIDARARGTKDNSYGTCVGRVKSGPMSFARISTDEIEGTIAACIGEGKFTDDPLKTFGAVGVVKINRLQELLQLLCRKGFEHHVAVSQSLVGKILFEAMHNYLYWDVYYHNS